MTARIDERRLGERAVSTTALLPLLTDNFLETLRLAAIACGRHDVGQAEVISFALAFDLEFAPEIRPRYNIAPTQQVPVIRTIQG